MKQFPEKCQTMKIDYLIVGQGLAGTCLAHQLFDRNQSFKIIQNDKLPSSSKVAGGMINPLTGKRLARTWKHEIIFDYLDEFYTYLEDKLNTKLLYKTQLFRPYKNENQKHQFEKAIELKRLNELIDDVSAESAKSDIIEAPLGGLMTHQCGRLDMNSFLDSSKAFFKESGYYLEGNFENNSIISNPNLINYQSFEFRKVIFCEGIHAQQNPLFNWLPFNAVKGETLDVSLGKHKLEMIVNQGTWIMPMTDNTYKMGSTYDWDNLNFETSETGKNEILDKSKYFLKIDPKILGQSAGIRPAVVDRRPIIGKHPKYDQVYIFNGLGTKGVSLAPYFSKELAEHLIEQKEIDIESTIERFYPLYS
jgi:glycine/D-amino acid oxidase-like deaminating enzyme